MKRILFLGAAPHQCPAIQYARDQGHRVFTCDYLPDNPGHRLAHQSFLISVVNLDEVTTLARSLQVDAVIGYASEPCSLAAARVADALQLPGCGFRVASIIADKAAFRRLLRDEDIQDIPFAVFPSSGKADARRWMSEQARDVVLKPVDGSGSKGVTIKPTAASFDRDFENALAASASERVIVERHVGRSGFQVGGDGFFENGRLAFVCLCESFPVAGMGQPDIICKMFPSSHSPASLDRLRELIEQSGRAAGLRSGPVNFDALIRPDGSPFLIEMAARSGGNFLPDIIGHHTGTNLVAAAVEISLHAGWHLPVAPGREPGYHAYYMLHSRKSGILRSIDLHRDLAPYLLMHEPYAGPGAAVNAFAKAGDALGALLFQFDSRARMETVLAHMDELCTVEVEAAS